MPTFIQLTLSILALFPMAAAAAPAPPIWGYMGGGNDDEGWGTLSPDFAICDTGQNQSPVEIGKTFITAAPPLSIRYHDTQAHMEKKDRTLVISTPGAGNTGDQGHRYALEEIRFHTPAEHEVAGRLHPAELHLIHRDAQGKILIVAVFMEVEPKGNALLQKILDTAPHKAKTLVPLAFNPKDLLPKKRNYYSYSGSLSWPPCSEGVEWRIMKEPITVSKEQMQALGALLARNARLLQPLYLRTVKETLN